MAPDLNPSTLAVVLARGVCGPVNRSGVSTTVMFSKRPVGGGARATLLQNLLPIQVIPASSH